MIEYTYRLRSQVKIQQENSGVVAILHNPLLALRLNKTAGQVLSLCQEWRTPADIASCLQVKQTQLEKLLPNLAARQLLDRKPFTTKLTDWPTVSIIVPVRNRPLDLEACVKSLRNLDYPAGKLEIILVDDASTDTTPQVVQQLDVDKAICRTGWSGPASCRNAGAEVATGEILAYTDSDCEVNPDWLSELVPHFADENVGIVGGRVDSFSLETHIERYESVVSSLYMGEVERDCRPNTAIPFLPTANLLIRRNLWQELGGFDPDFPIGEDVDLVWRVHMAGKRVVYIPRGAVRHKYRCHIRSFTRHKAFYGGSETFLLRKHPVQRKLFFIPRQRLPFIGMLLLGSLYKNWRASLALSAFFPIVESMRDRKRLQRFGAKISFQQALLTTARNYDNMLFHITSNVARYYSLPLFGLSLFYRPLFGLLLSCFAYPSIHLYRKRKPPLAWPIFAGLYWLELIAHQVGMIRRCVQCRTIKPLIPALKV